MTQVAKLRTKHAAIREIAPTRQELRRFSRTAKIMAGIAIAGGVLAGGTTHQAQDAFEKIGYTPTPSVNSTGAEALITLTDDLREYGPPVLGIGMVAGGALWLSRRRNPNGQLAAEYAITHQTSRRGRRIFYAGVMGLVVGASGLGFAASEGANAPIKAMADMVGADENTTPLITGSEVLPLNTTTIDYPKVSAIIKKDGGTPVPFIAALGHVKNPDATRNPSTAPTILLPSAVIEQSLGISMPEIQNCDDMSIVVGDQLGVPEGGTAIINDKKATVVKTVHQMPGLDRVGVIGSLEQGEKCLYPGLPMSGALALGLDGKQAMLQQQVREQIDLVYKADSFAGFEQRYKEFWDHSVKPPQMILILSSLALGSSAIAGMQTSEILTRRKNIGMLLSQGVDKKVIKRSYNIAAHGDTLLATTPSLIAAVALADLYNSAQFGIAEAVNISSVGAGYTALFATTLGTSWFRNRMINKIDRAAELRSSV
ncbi:MAG TPA: FtsX-like permease family protein [Candidatus Bathyarchaeia archaeon]|nr:FtsX-like permease family protein [Candidatus Bathyarchaeia archaeon]